LGWRTCGAPDIEKSIGCAGEIDPLHDGTLRQATDTSVSGGILRNAMAAYDYLCMACEHRFEQRRPMTASVDTALACPSCGSERVRRQFSFVAGTASSSEPGPHGAGGCACGGACGCG
jgi:putative FmdB family regulatory protein